MHPIERLRFVAQAEGADPSLVAREAAGALASVAATDPAGLLPACRRLVGRHLSSGPVWSLTARVLTAGEDATKEAFAVASEIDGDKTARTLVRELPDEATVLIVGWPDIAGEALRSRGDIEILVTEGQGLGSAYASRIVADADVSVVPDAGVAAAAVQADLVLLEATAAGPTGALATTGSHAAGAVAKQAGKDVWLVAGVGRVLPQRLWEAMLARVAEAGEPWERNEELVPADVMTAVITASGVEQTADALAASKTPAAPELFRDAR